MYYQLSNANIRKEQSLNFSYGFFEQSWNQDFYPESFTQRIDLVDVLYTIIRDFNFSKLPLNNASLPIILIHGKGLDKSQIPLKELIQLIKQVSYKLKIIIVSTSINDQQRDLYQELLTQFSDIFNVKEYISGSQQALLDELLQDFSFNGIQSHLALGFSNTSQDQKHFSLVKDTYNYIVQKYKPQYYCCFIYNFKLYRIENHKFIELDKSDDQNMIINQGNNNIVQIDGTYEQNIDLNQNLMLQRNIDFENEYQYESMYGKEKTYEKKKELNCCEEMLLESCLKLLFLFILVLIVGIVNLV